jgi:hypothetical protein
MPQSGLSINRNPDRRQNSLLKRKAARCVSGPPVSHGIARLSG